MAVPTAEIQRRMKRFLDACCRGGLKVTHQRSEIFRELAATEEHPDAETVYRRVPQGANRAIMCPHCRKDIREAIVLSAAASIAAKRRARQGKQITSDQARAMQRLSVEARRQNAAKNESAD